MGLIVEGFGGLGLKVQTKDVEAPRVAVMEAVIPLGLKTVREIPCHTACEICGV